MFLAISQARAGLSSLLLRWSGNEFINFQEVLISGSTLIEALISGDDIYLLFAKTVSLGKIYCSQCIHSYYQNYLAFI